MMKIEPANGPFGCVVHGVDIAAGIDAQTYKKLHEALYENRVLVMKNQTGNEDAFLDFGRQWGAPIPHVLDTHRMPGFPEMLEIGNLTERSKDRQSRNNAAFWHTDQSYDANPATSTMLYARVVPDVGGETRVVDTKAAYDSLDKDTKTRIEHLTALHLYGATAGRDGEEATLALNTSQAEEVPPTAHPLVRSHTVTGQKALYGVAGTAFGIKGMAADEAEALIADLKAHCLQDKYIYKHKYEVGDITMWDTQMTLHCATPIDAPNGPGTERLLWRISVRGKPSLYQ